MSRFPNQSHPLAQLDEMEHRDRLDRLRKADTDRVNATAARMLGRGVRALAGIEPIAPAPRRN